ncbi:hypothetical protein [Curtobacterium sp. 24E2]|nr:hypothetical protein JN350_05225 [Curtobacterium sp. 24E2]
MSHKKRAATAFKSMGAAGLAAATIVSGLGLSSAAHAKPSTEQSAEILATDSEFSFVWRESSSVYRSVNGFRAEVSAATVGSYSSLASAKNAALKFTVVPESASTFKIKSTRFNLCLLTDFTNNPPRDNSVVYMNPCDVPRQPQLIFTRDDKGIRVANFSVAKPYVAPRYLTETNTFFSFGTSSEGFLDLPSHHFNPFAATVKSTDSRARTASVSGTSQANARVVFSNGQETIANENGEWSVELEDLKLGEQTLTLEQRLEGEKFGDAIDLVVDLDVVEEDLTAKVDSVDHAAGTARALGHCDAGRDDHDRRAEHHGRRGRQVEPGSHRPAGREERARRRADDR